MIQTGIYLLSLLLITFIPWDIIKIAGILLIPVPLLEMTCRRKPWGFGNVLVVSYGASLSLIWQGKLRYVVLVLIIDVLAFFLYRINVTLVDTDAKLQESTNYLQVVEKYALVGQLSAGLAHEIRNPLTSVKGFIQLLQKKHQEGLDKEYMDIILGELDRVNNLVREFLVLAKPSEPKCVNIPVDSLIKETVLFMESEAILREISISAEIPDGLPAVWVDIEQIKQVFINIIFNAIEAIGDGGNILIRVADDQEMVAISIKDDGPGIADSVLANIFTPFVTTKSEGTGLGLAVSKRIIEKHHGCIEVFSTLGQGTSFKIFLPRGAKTC